MSSAGVRSISALEDFKTILANFESEAKEALAVTDMAVRRSLEWFQHDLLKQWQSEFRRREEAVTNARAELERCRMQSFGDRTPDCTDQKVALKKAQTAPGRGGVQDQGGQEVEPYSRGGSRRIPRSVARVGQHHRGRVAQGRGRLESNARCAGRLHERRGPVGFRRQHGQRRRANRRAKHGSRRQAPGRGCFSAGGKAAAAVTATRPENVTAEPGCRIRRPVKKAEDRAR